ncbi:hypothetical protein MLC59_01890 [Marinobacter bryozoorum]|uniref:hypothetical protein n=1 Tax=Marinobacter bryozoorum TaxID=256324 RepID=UPI002003AB5F|nr:hypothetical protein [Marinobacter bryozoorum]MCK7542921.1 hypothetical protein [Marinobacter bryozoorum]
MNIELKPIAESKIRQLGGDVCGVLVRNEAGAWVAVSEGGRVMWLDGFEGQASSVQPEQPSAAVVPEAKEIIDRVVEELENGFVRCERCGDQEDTATLDCMSDLKRLQSLLTVTHPRNGEQGGEWPAMPDKFYEGLGWMHAECCAALDRGEDPRAFEVGDMVKRCIHDLTRPQPPKSKEGES